MENQSNTYQNREYMIFNVSELPLINFSQVLQTSESTVRRSVDETKGFVKWVGDIPESVNNLKYQRRDLHS